MAVQCNITPPQQRDPSPQVHDFAPLIQALLRPEAYPHPAEDLRVHETHISWVILAGPYAYKLKKHVNFGFLDFSTFARRAADCAVEVAPNRRLCPDAYCGVVEIVERDGTYWVGGPGRVVEPAVWMRRLPESGMLPALLERDAVDAPLIRCLAKRTKAPLRVLLCEADEAAVKARLAARAHDPQAESDARLALWSALRAAFVEPTELPYAVHLDMTQPLDDVIAHVLAIVEQG